MTDPFAGIGFEQKVEEQPQAMSEKQSNPFAGVGFAGEANDPFAGLALGGQDVKLSEVPRLETVGSTVERTVEDEIPTESSFTDKAAAAFDIGIRTPAALAFGMASWPFAQAARFGAIGGQKAQQALGIVPEMTDEQITELGNQTAEWFSSLGGNLTPKTETGKTALNIAGKVVEPIAMAAHWINSGIDREKYPHLGALADTTTEGMMFAFLHKFGTEAVDVGKKQLKAREKKGQAKVRAQKKLEEKQAEILAKAEEAAKVGELQDIIKEKFTGELYSPERQALLQNKYEVERTAIVNSTKTGKQKKKALKKLDDEYKQQQEKMATAKAAYEKFKQRDPVAEAAKGNLIDLENFRGKVGQDRVRQQMEINQQKADFDRLYNAEEGPTTFGIQAKEPIVPTPPTMSELSQRGRGFEGEVRKPDLGAEPVSGLKTETSPIAPQPQARVEFISEEGIPRATYQLENGKIKEVEKIGEQKSYQINPETKKIELVENVPGQKSVYQILLDPLKNENGFIEIPTSRKKLLESTTPAFRENVRRFGELAEKSGKSMVDFLKDNDFSKKEIDKMVKVAEAVKLESPFKAPKSDVVIPEGKDPLRIQQNEVNINTGPKANPKMPIGDKFFEGIRKIKEINLPPILQAITPTIHFIKDTKSPELLDLWHKTKAIEGNRLKDVKILKDTTGALREQYPKRKLREEAFIKIMSQDKLGREALTMLDIKPIDGPIKYEGLVSELNVQFKDLFNQLNTMRESIGKAKIAERQSYLPMIAQENFYSQIKQLFKGQEGEFNHPNMVLDSVQAINARHAPQAVEATALRHLKRRGLRKGVKLETDPLKLLAQYGSTAYKHIHYSPFNMFINQLTTGKFKVKNSKGIEYDWTMANQKPELHEFLSRWSNALAGKPNVMHGPALRFLEQGAQKLSSNLTAAVLGWSARTVLVQPTALLPTATEFGITPTVKGLMRTALRSKKDPINRSQELSNRLADASMVRDITNQLQNPLMRAVSLPGEKALSAMKFVDGVVAEATWRTAFNANKHLGENTAIRLADEAVVRSQGSGFVGDLSPIQMNALGKAVTLWQTFTINNMNWLGREVLNIKNPERNPAETARRVMTYVIGTALINTLFEDELGIQSPQPAPIKEMIRAAQREDSNFSVAYQGLKEMTELAPFLSSLKFGSSPAGAVAEFLKDLSEAAADDLPRALNGDKEAMKRVGFVAAKLTGVPGTQQIKRISQGTPLGFPVEKLGGSAVQGKTTRVKTPRTIIKRIKTRRQK